MAPACANASRSGHSADYWQSPNVDLLAGEATSNGAVTFTGLRPAASPTLVYQPSLQIRSDRYPPSL